MKGGGGTFIAIRCNRYLSGQKWDVQGKIGVTGHFDWR